MLPRTDINTARPATPVEATGPAPSATDPRQEVQARLNRIAIGQQVRAEVLSQLRDGSSLVDVDGAQARMMLPAGTRVGDNVELMFLARTPRPTFLLLPGQGSTTTSLSNIGRLIDQVLQIARNHGKQNDAGSITGNAPLLPEGAELDTGRLANALKDAFGFSGLFYESHLGEWVSGNRSLQDIGREPQSALARNSAEPIAQQARDASQAAETISAPSIPARPLGHAEVLDADVLPQSQQTQPLMNAEAAKLVSLQLDTLEQRRAHWQGELFPGQPMEWDVAEEKPGRERNRSDKEQDAIWTSTVRFRLPSLGELSASIRLNGDRVHVQIGTDDELTAQSLRSHLPALALALDAAGSPLESFNVKKEDPA